MPFCSKCGAEIDAEAKFCFSCGTPVGPPAVREIRRRREERRPTPILPIILFIIFGAVIVTAVVSAILLGFWQPFGQVVGSGNLITEEKNFTDFTILEVGYGFDVEITRSSSYHINITSDDNVLEYIQVFKTGSTLTIRLKTGYNYQFVTLQTRITMPELHQIEFSGGTQGTVEGFSISHRLTLELSGGSSLQGNVTTSEDAQITLSGGSAVELEGAANNLIVSASSGSQIELSDFPVHNASVNLSGGSQATINLDGRLDANLSGGSQLQYVGEPTLGNIQTSGDSTIGKKE